ncbi:MAG: sigma-70 family RNA polymerase sigma factor [Bacteroidia bacterium]|nr:sigma-70 family RNA polymerase sigma factor [Bacteroidia bacterium]
MNLYREEQFRELYEAYKDKVFRLCLGFLANEAQADDLFQDIMLKIWNKLDSFREESQIGTWVYRIATNTALQSIHKQKKAKETSAPLPAEMAEIPQTSVDEGDPRLTMLKKQMATLKEIDRLILSLLLEGCSYQEIAEITGLSMSNVGVKIKRIKERLRKKLTHHE